MEKPGRAVAAAIVLEAIERGNAEEIFDVLDSNGEISDEELVSVVKKFEAGLQALVADAKRARN